MSVVDVCAETRMYVEGVPKRVPVGRRGSRKRRRRVREGKGRRRVAVGGADVCAAFCV